MLLISLGREFSLGCIFLLPVNRIHPVLHSCSKACLFIQQLFIESLLHVSTILDTGDTAVIKTPRLLFLMEVGAGRVDRQLMTLICIHAYIIGGGV